MIFLNNILWNIVIKAHSWVVIRQRYKHLIHFIFWRETATSKNTGGENCSFFPRLIIQPFPCHSSIFFSSNFPPFHLFKERATQRKTMVIYVWYYHWYTILFVETVKIIKFIQTQYSHYIKTKQLVCIVIPISCTRSLSISPENVRKPLIFWCFQRV